MKNPPAQPGDFFCAMTFGWETEENIKNSEYFTRNIDFYCALMYYGSIKCKENGK